MKEKVNQVELSKIEVGKTFKIGNIEFIKFSEEAGKTIAVTKDIIFKSEFGKNNNFAESKVFEKLKNEFLPKIADVIGYENVCDIHTDLKTLDGLKPYEPLTSKVSLPTFDFYRDNVEIFDKYKVDAWWWTATPESASPHDAPNWITCVSPSGYIYGNFYFNYVGVRPFLKFVSSIFVSCEN